MVLTNLTFHFNSAFKYWLEQVLLLLLLLLQDVLKSTRVQLEKELMMDDVLRIEDMPSYSLLC